MEPDQIREADEALVAINSEAGNLFRGTAGTAGSELRSEAVAVEGRHYFFADRKSTTWWGTIQTRRSRVFRNPLICNGYSSLVVVEEDGWLGVEIMGLPATFATAI